jgi:hypothetical protein
MAQKDENIRVNATVDKSTLPCVYRKLDSDVVVMKSAKDRI